MLKEIGILVSTKWDFFGKLLIQHIEISIIAVLIAIVLGGIVGIAISEYQKSFIRTVALVIDTAWSPMRSKSLLAFNTVITVRKS